MAAKTVFVYPLTGGRDFPIPFEYLARKFIQVTLKGGAGQLKLTLNTDYRFTTKTQITTTQAWSPTSDYDTIEIRRYTSATERLVDFNDGSILRAYDLNLSQIQTLHVAEEARDLTADTIGVNGDGDLDARNRKIVNVARGSNNADAVNVGQLREFDTSTGSNADRAVAAADRADQYRDQAGQSAINASVSESVAVASASTATVAAGNAQASAADAEDSKDIVVPLVPIVELAAQQAAQASADALKASQAAAQAVIDVKSLGAVPIGSIVLFHSEKLPAGYLKLDGSTFDAALYPDLVTYLGSNVLPNWTDRHVKMVGTDLTAGEIKEWETPAHSHDRGDMDITGRIGAFTTTGGVVIPNDVAGAMFSMPSGENLQADAAGSGDIVRGYGVGFQASRSWTGRTSSEGNSDKVETRRIGGVYAMKAAGVVADEGLAQLDGVVIRLATAESNINKLTSNTLGIYSAGTNSGWGGREIIDFNMEGGRTFGFSANGNMHFNNNGVLQSAIIGENGDIIGSAWGGGGLSTWLVSKGLDTMGRVEGGFSISSHIPKVEYHIPGVTAVMNFINPADSNFYLALSNGAGDWVSTIYKISAAAATAHFNLTCYASGGFHTGSDRSIKRDIKPIKGLDALKNLQGYKWVYNEDSGVEGHISAGLIAQDVQEVLPEAVSMMDNGKLAINYNGVVGLLVNAVNELSAQVKELQAKLK